MEWNFGKLYFVRTEKLIKNHLFNSAWWGKSVGIVEESKLDSITQEDLDTAGQTFDWIEARATTKTNVNAKRLSDLGFFQVDTQLKFKIRLSQLATTPSLDNLQVEFADRSPFEIAPCDIKEFAAERFQHLPGCTTSKIKDRYVLWSNQLIQERPQYCLRVLLSGEVQGFFLSEETATGFRLALAMLHSNAKVTGMHLYQKALLAYAEKGIRIGGASFSVHNSPVHNIYANLGARFLTAERFWFHCLNH